MRLPLCIVAIAVLVGCGSNDDLGGRPLAPIAPELPIDAPPADSLPADAPPADSPPGDAPMDDAPPTDPPPTPELGELCGTTPVTLDDWEDCYLRRWCDSFVGCSSMNSFTDAQECVDQVDAWLGGRFGAERRERARAVEQGRASLDPVAFTRCLAETSRAFCDTAKASVACATRFRGSLDAGDDCYTDIECSSPGATCESTCSDACCLGTCRAKLVQDQTCRGSDSCEPGLVCHGTCRSGDIGTACGGDRDCDPGAWCNAGTCAAVRAPGAACSGLAQCGGETTCVGLSIVDSRPGRCVRISHPGDRCDFACYGNLYCDASGTCRELPGLGDSCTATDACRGIDTSCIAGQCALLGDAGARCDTSQACRPGLFCGSELSQPDPKCVAPGDTGQPCTDPAHCQSYLCSGTRDTMGVCLSWNDSCPVAKN